MSIRLSWFVGFVSRLSYEVASVHHPAPLFETPSFAQAPPKYPALPSETPATFKPSFAGFDYERRDVMIPMRDGVKLHTVILVPKGAQGRADAAHAHALRREPAHHAPRQRPPRRRRSTATTTPPT